MDLFQSVKLANIFLCVVKVHETFNFWSLYKNKTGAFPIKEQEKISR